MTQYSGNGKFLRQKADQLGLQPGSFRMIMAPTAFDGSATAAIPDETTRRHPLGRPATDPTAPRHDMGGLSYSQVQNFPFPDYSAAATQQPGVQQPTPTFGVVPIIRGLPG